MLIGHGLNAFFDLNHLVDIVHRARPVERQQINNIINFLNAVFLASLHHATGFKLKHPHGFTSVKQLEGWRVVQWNIVNVKLRCVLPNVPNSIMNNRQVFEP